MKETNQSKRRIFLKRLGGLAAVLALPAGMKAGKPDEMEGNFLHVVFFWLKNDDEKTKKVFMTELRKFIDNVDLIKSQHIGKPADTDRPVIDNTYSFSLILILTIACTFISQAQSEFSSTTIGIGVVVSDLEKSLDFYTNAIGMKNTGCCWHELHNHTCDKPYKREMN